MVCVAQAMNTNALLARRFATSDDGCLLHEANAMYTVRQRGHEPFCGGAGVADMFAAIVSEMIGTRPCGDHSATFCK